MQTSLELLLLTACVSIYIFTAAVSASILLKSNTVDTKNYMLVSETCACRYLHDQKGCLSAIS